MQRYHFLSARNDNLIDSGFNGTVTAYISQTLDFTGSWSGCSH